jgi:hypothetical protein
MDPRHDGELPEEHRHALAERAVREPGREDPEPSGDEPPAPLEPAGNGWLLLGIFLLVTIGVLMLLIFASGGNADSSMML